MTVSEFIDDYVSNLSVITKNHPYIAFPIICAGIEFLGKCLDDNNDFHTYSPNLVKKQFNKAMKLFPKEYSGIAIRKSLRNSMLHSLLPDKKIWLAERKNIGKKKHLKSYLFYGLKRNVVILDDFFEDFKNACTIVKNKIQSGELNHKKIKADILIT